MDVAETFYSVHLDIIIPIWLDLCFQTAISAGWAEQTRGLQYEEFELANTDGNLTSAMMIDFEEDNSDGETGGAYT